MSSQSSPTSARHSTPSSHASAALTPSRKVQALLAQFSDSDSDNKSSPNRSATPTKLRRTPISRGKEAENESESDEDGDIQPRGRLAARLLGKQNSTTVEEHSQETETGQPEHERIISAIRTYPRAIQSSKHTDSSEDEITTSVHTRPGRVVNQDEHEHEHEHDQDASRRSPATPRSPSPLFFPSPTLMQRDPSILVSPRQSLEPNTFKKSSDDGRSKFLKLVQKHRKERLAKEAAEIVKRAVGNDDSAKTWTKRARGSSPADDSDEDNADGDEDAVERIQKQARPTRKASKKALEEMNRETQRISRNMQLAHQTKTKKKITKENLLARFNFTTNVTVPPTTRVEAQSSTSTSSAGDSDAEDRQRQATTPLTSPMRETFEHEITIKDSQAKDLTSLLGTGEITDKMRGALHADEDIPNLLEVVDGRSLNKGMRMLYDYHRNDITVKSPKPYHAVFLATCPTSQSLSAPPTMFTKPSKIGLQYTAFARDMDSNSDDEIEIVQDRGLKRKYAVFETLPKRKAKEMPSHLALRSLANVFGNNDKKNVMNAAELESTLRKKARVQAIAERQQKIEELKAKGIVVQSAEERERDQQEVEDLVERARQEASEIQKREKELAKKDGTYVKDNLDDEDDDSEDADFEEELEESQDSGSDGEGRADDLDEEDEDGRGDTNLVDDEVDEAESGDETEESQEEDHKRTDAELRSDIEATTGLEQGSRPMRKPRIIVDDDDDDDEDEDQKFTITAITRSPQLPVSLKTPQSVPRSARKVIPGLQMSDDLPIGLSQAFAATMAESQTQFLNNTQGQDSLDYTADLPSPRFATMAPLLRLDSVELVSDSQPSASQAQPLNVELVSQSQAVPESSWALTFNGTQHTPSQRQAPFEPTQDNGYVLSPFLGNRFAETPNIDAPNSTVETVILPQGVEDSPIAHRQGRLQRGRNHPTDGTRDDATESITAFKIMRQAAAKAKAAEQAFDKKKSDARNIVDEAAEESEDEYAGLGGASDDSGDDEENEYDRQMIDEDTQLGKGDEAKLAGLYADRERERDEKEVSKLLKDITTGALRRKRGLGDDLDLSDEEDAAARRREAKRREFARMRRELLKDEAVGKIAEDKKKEAFLRSIEDRADVDDEDEHIDEREGVPDSQSQDQAGDQSILNVNSQADSQNVSDQQQPLRIASNSRLNRRFATVTHTNETSTRKPATLAEIRESVSFLIEEPDSQAAMVDLGLSDSEDEPEAYVNLDRHLREAETDENDLDDDHEDLGDFIVDDIKLQKQDSQDDVFKKPELPQERAHFTERRSRREDIVDRLSLLRQASSSASSTTSTTSASTKMAFFSSKTAGDLSGVPMLLRRATTNSSLGSMSGRENVSATGVVTSKTERGNAGEEKEFIRKGSGGRRNAVNYQAERKTLREEKMSARAGIIKASKSKKKSGFLGGLFRGDSWE